MTPSSNMDAEPKTRSGEDYKMHFQPREFLRTYFRHPQEQPEDNYLAWALKMMQKVFCGSGLHGHRLLDVGSGPTIHQVLSACEVFDEIYLSDFTELNRNELQLWLEDSPEAYNWNRIIQYVCDLEGNVDTCESKSERLRRKVRSVLPCDVNQHPPVCGIDPPFDYILTSLCLDAACLDIEMYHQAVAHLAGLLNDGGNLGVLTSFEATFYYVGNERFKALSLSEDTVREAMTKAGLSITVYEKHLRSNADSNVCSDYKAMVFVVAQKIPEQKE
uniref:Nicotinamide N-methyltransferase n=1 Tax=Eptatretus burgeri TaxID=7764 RepID=A0A8C4QPE8_EPTBU